ncbi:MAG: hypothetical protein KDI33_06965 [Halioglobus sp.]|nr:hypothetical protein [Halioglobus sp.]
MSPYKVPKVVRIVDAIPLTVVGKLIRKACAKWLRKAEGAY